VRHRAVDSQFGADPDADHHETDLVDHAVHEHAPQVILDHRIENGERSHRGAEQDEHPDSTDLCAGETACQRVDRHLGRERRQEYGARHGRFGVRIGGPVVQQREHAFDPERDEDQQRARTIQSEVRRVERDRPGLVRVQYDPREQDHARGELHDEVAHPGAVGPFRLTGPDQEHRTDGEDLPEHEQRDQVTRKDGPDRAARVHQGSGLLGRAAHPECVDQANQCGEVEQITEEQTERIDSHDGQFVSEQAEWSRLAVR